jgi:hypothetical protein
MAPVELPLLSLASPVGKLLSASHVLSSAPARRHWIATKEAKRPSSLRDFQFHTELQAALLSWQHG